MRIAIEGIVRRLRSARYPDASPLEMLSALTSSGSSTVKNRRYRRLRPLVAADCFDLTLRIGFSSLILLRLKRTCGICRDIVSTGVSGSHPELAMPLQESHRYPYGSGDIAWILRVLKK
jgi:hypothetical protein